MNNKLYTLLFFLLSFSPLFAQTEKDFPVEDVLDEIQVGLVEMQKKLGENDLPPLQSIEVTLETYYKKSTGGKIKILIFSFGKTWERELSQQLKLILKPPKIEESKLVSKDKSLAKNLVDLVVEAAKGVQKAKENKQVPLNTSKLEATIKFTIISDSEGGGEWEITPISATITGKKQLKKTAIHTMKIIFAIPEK